MQSIKTLQILRVLTMFEARPISNEMKSFALAILILMFPATAYVQDTGGSADEVNTRAGEDLPEDMPAPPEDAPPAEAPATGGTDDRPPHPETPESLEEQQPTKEVLASTKYRWLPGHWVWTGQQFEWRVGTWIYDVKDHDLVPPRWEWDGKQWVFHNAGWAKDGTKKVVYSVTPVTKAESSAEAPPAAQETEVEVYVEPAPATVYVWTGVYVAPLIVYPMWHPWYHYHWYHRHPAYVRRPVYRSRRYNYARTHRRAHYRYHNRPSTGRPGSRPGTRPPSTGRPGGSRPPSTGQRPGAGQRCGTGR